MVEHNIPHGQAMADAATSEIEYLIANFNSKQDFIRDKSRQQIISMGSAAVGPLVDALKDKHDQVRWQAAKALGQIADPSSAPALVAALEDHEFDIRWLAAEALVNIGVDGVEAMLEALVKKPESLWLRESAHHVLSHIIGEDMEIDHHIADHPVTKDTGLHDALAPVMKALHGSAPADDIAPAARKALDSLTRL